MSPQEVQERRDTINRANRFNQLPAANLRPRRPMVPYGPVRSAA